MFFPLKSPLPERPLRSRRHAVSVGLATVTCAAMMVASFATTASAAPATLPIKLGTTATFSVLAGAAATIPGSTLPGEVGARAAITDDANTRYGSIRHSVNDTATTQALSELGSVYSTLSSLAATGALSGDDLTGQVITPGVYHRVAAYAMTTPVTFDAKGDPAANFVLQSDAALNTTAGTTMNLINGAQASHIFWITRGAATLGASSRFFGTIISYAAVTVGASSIVCGRALSVTAAVTLDANIFNCAAAADAVAPTIAINGGANAATASATPTVTGTTSAPTGSSVRVTIGTDVQTVSVISGGTWTAKAKTAQPTGAIAVTASVTVAGLTGTAVQTLTYTPAAVAPTIAINGGAKATVTTSTPTVTGTTSAPAGTVIRVSVGSQNFTPVVKTGGTWSVTVAPLPNCLVTVTATVSVSGLTASATQALTIAVVQPLITINGGPTATTNSTTPTISGTSSTPAGTIVTVKVGGQVLTTKVLPDHSWSIKTGPLSYGPQKVVASVPVSCTCIVGTAMQTLTVLQVAPSVYITGGSAATVYTPNSVISGTSNLPNGSTVSIVVGTCSAVSAIVQNGTWSISTASLSPGSYTITATVKNGSGTAASYTQILTVR